MRFPDDVPVLTDGVITLRAPTAADIDPVTEACQDSVMQQWTTIPVPYQREHAVSFLTELIPNGWREGTTWGWAIEYQGRYAGAVDLRGGEGGVGEIGFATAPWARGGGTMTRAVELAVRYAFDRLGWDRVIWRAFVGNWASRRVAWKAGFRDLVVIPGGGLQRGTRRDEWVATIARTDDGEPQGNWWRLPELDGGTFRLRQPRPEDAPRIVEACRDERTTQWLPGIPSPYDLEAAHRFMASRREQLASGKAAGWIVADAATDRLLADVNVFDLDSRGDSTTGEIGYWTHPDARGRGLMSAVVGLVIRQAFEPVENGGLGRRRLTLCAADGNTASRRVAEVNGFTHVGTARAAARTRDGYRDKHTYDLLATDLPG